ncbi:DNA-processing protein DprA [Coraliomargarita parva]|uniref:DNA-processing protein DprA n=1 Tax=Coraliomargarita parva TaxID=3014050 RepID=UPI0022B39D7B|nr:DNA-processing protein DprA [Coraliomargarita parva]
MSVDLTSRQALLVLNGIPRVGPVMLCRLLDTFDGNPVSILTARPSALKAVDGIGDKVVEVIRNWQSHFDLAREEARMAASGIRFITRECSGYPEMLCETYDPPIGLYWKGAYLVDRPCVAIVGTRRATLYGHSVARKFAAELARLGFCIVSGMARGTDTAAHEGALDAGGKTVAVMGCGLDIVYPPENIELYKRIGEAGALVSEFPFGRRADRQTFPMRNRVVAGMCEAVIVVESDLAGGSMITARFAGEQGRTLMAVPGRIDQTCSAGCHQLIRDGAILVTSVDDVLEELRYSRPQEQELDFGQSSGTGGRVDLSDAERAVLVCLDGGAILSADAIASECGLPFAEVAAILMGLELKRIIVKRSDGCFEAH